MTLLKDDILALVRQKLLEESQHLLAQPPPDLEANFVKSSGGSEKAASLGAAGTKLLFDAAVPAAVVAGIRQYLGDLKS